jgi:hypothetical protein
MTYPGQVFISYKRQDEARVARLVLALEKCGFKVWWDRDLPHDAGWRHVITRELGNSGCAVAVWTEASVATSANEGFMLEEAAEAKRRNILLAVRFDRVRAPMGFHEAAQPVDLMDWTGGTKDPFFSDLCNAIRAKLEHRPAPAPIAYRQRWRRRLTWGGIGSALISGTAVFAFPTVLPVGAACTIAGPQPGLSDLCGAIGIGSRPNRAEREAWEARPAQSCEALRVHVQRFPDGHFRSQAADLLAARRVTQVETWQPGVRELALYVGAEGDARAPSTTEPSARAAALSRAQIQAEQLCKAFAATTLYRYVSAQPEVPQWQCQPVGPSLACAGEGKVVCALEERRVEERESCGEN